ncbi:hypothetical protein Mgrana_03218 [Meiothermus granaticius NBRC 107808]|uniref:Uncharacterized protein n=1 Tax=Meiothermus granaticius NBRC 107808 TaxID=1227551 RepID=A0A399F4P1_9DEIN|nr:hypothetical protein Mgrana_03218 [Meiothermus granaticius NBRC 107808]
MQVQGGVGGQPPGGQLPPLPGIIGREIKPMPQRLSLREPHQYGKTRHPKLIGGEGLFQPGQGEMPIGGRDHPFGLIPPGRCPHLPHPRPTAGVLGGLEPHHLGAEGELHPLGLGQPIQRIRQSPHPPLEGVYPQPQLHPSDVVQHRRSLVGISAQIGGKAQKEGGQVRPRLDQAGQAHERMGPEARTEAVAGQGRQSGWIGEYEGGAGPLIEPAGLLQQPPVALGFLRGKLAEGGFQVQLRRKLPTIRPAVAAQG